MQATDASIVREVAAELLERILWLPYVRLLVGSNECTEDCDARVSIFAEKAREANPAGIDGSLIYLDSEAVAFLSIYGQDAQVQNMEVGPS